MKDRNLLTSQNFTLLTFSICIISSYFLYHINYGWLDDIIMLNIINGNFSKEPYYIQNLMTGVSDILSYLYNHIPSIPWYGMFFSAACVIAMYLYVRTVFEGWMYKRKSHLLVLFGIIFCFYTIFLSDLLALLNFSKTSVLLTGVCTLILWDNSKKNEKTGQTIILLLFVIGYSIRKEIANLTIILLLSYVLIETFFRTEYIFALKRFLKRILLIVLAINIFFKLIERDDYQLGNEIWPYVLNIVDGNKVPDLKSINSSEDSIRLLSIQSYYVFDTLMINQSFLNKYGGDNRFQNLSIEKINQNIKIEFNKLKYRFECANKGLKQIKKFFLATIIIFLLTIISFYLYKSQKIDLRTFCIILFTHLTFYVMIFLLAGIIKYEDRFFAPAFLLTVSFTMLLIKPFYIHIKSLWAILILLVLIPICFLRMKQLIEVRNWKAIDVLNKKNYIDELNSFNNQIFIHDYWSQHLIYQTPFKDAKLDKTNTHIVFGDNPLYELESYRNYIHKEICNYRNLSEFYECISQKENVYFIMNDMRKNILERYYEMLYNKKIKFNPILGNSHFSQNTYSYFWEKQSFKYYKVEIEH